MKMQTINNLSEILSARTDIKFSLLFGSRAKGSENEQSDWDIAIFFKDNSNAWDNLGKKEEIRRQVAKALKIKALFANHVAGQGRFNARVSH
jgi:predicted nucleotidyltransferase